MKDYPANILTFPRYGLTGIRFPEGATLTRLAPARKPKPGEDPLTSLAGIVMVFPADPRGERIPRTPFPMPVEGQPIRIEPGTRLNVMAIPVTAGGRQVIENRYTVWTTIRMEFAEPTRVVLFNEVPNAPDGKTWLRPFGPFTSKHGYPLLYTYSLIIALICGTAGLPHILVRFYTNPDGRAAKRTTLWVMVMLGSFYVFPPAWGTLGRNWMPQLYASGATDSVVIKLPMLLASPLWGNVLAGITSAGAFAAFMSTFSGLLVSMSGALAHDIYGKILRPNSSPESRLVAFKVAAVLIGAVSMGLGFLVESFDIAMMVGWAFAIAACSYFPLLLLGAWWPRLTVVGAAGGMLTGGSLALGAIVTSMLLDKKVIHAEVSPWSAP